MHIHIYTLYVLHIHSLSWFSLAWQLHLTRVYIHTLLHIDHCKQTTFFHTQMNNASNRWTAYLHMLYIIHTCRHINKPSYILITRNLQSPACQYLCHAQLFIVYYLQALYLYIFFRCCFTHHRFIKLFNLYFITKASLVCHLSYFISFITAFMRLHILNFTLLHWCGVFYLYFFFLLIFFFFIDCVYVCGIFCLFNHFYYYLLSFSLINCRESLFLFFIFLLHHTSL